jgi:hypothetical protein
MITLHWQKCIKNSLWCQCNEKLLNDGRLESRLGDHSVGISGVYVLWTGIDNRTVLKVGSGIIKDKLAAHLRNPEIQAYKPTRLYATWASTVSVNGLGDVQKRIEKLLGIVFKPKLVERLPDVDPIFANLPRWNKPVPPL